MPALASIVELDSRENAGLYISLFWHRISGEITVTIADSDPEAESKAFNVDPENALDAFRHPFAYAH